jgi:uncharacterized membrane protein
MSPSQIIVWFAICALAGWVFESAYALIRTGHWEKRGFLFGPICPIYGVGAVACFIAFGAWNAHFPPLPAWAVFLVCMAGSAVLEYVTSYVLERAFGTVWWDYSNMPLNLHGRICLPASLLFGVGGLLAVYVLLPAAFWVNEMVPAVVFEPSALVIVALIAIDATITCLSLTDLMKKVLALDEAANAQAEQRYQQVTGALHDATDRIQEAGAEAVSGIRNGAAERAQRVRDLGASLSTRQRRMLSHMRRFSTERARKAVELLRGSSEKDDADDEK